MKLSIRSWKRHSRGLKPRSDGSYSMLKSALISQTNSTTVLIQYTKQKIFGILDSFLLNSLLLNTISQVRFKSMHQRSNP